MPLRILRFCRKCLATRQSLTREACGGCASELLPLLDENGAISREFLVARGSCCDNGCRNCPYEKTQSTGGSRVGCANVKICQKCAASFECHGVSCWCEGISLTPATLKWLGRSYGECLCPSCLAEFESHKREGSARKDW
jgi:hypothetical protein